MTGYQFQLQKYKGRSTRFECPLCHRLFCFSRYVDMETQEHIHESVGKCDHDSSCGYHYKPKEFYQLNPTARPNWREKSEWVVDSRMAEIQQNPYKPMVSKEEPPCEPSYIDFSLVRNSQKSGSRFEQFLFNCFSEVDVRRVIEAYHLGRTTNKEVIFWQIDFKGKVRTGKIMDYNPKTGKNNKVFDWAHARMISDKKMTIFNLRQCLFGEHLLASNTDKAVILVEGYKNAVMTAILLPNFIVVGFDNKNSFRLKKVTCLKGRNVMVFADLDAHDAWTNVVAQIKVAGLCNIVISPLIKRYADEHKANPDIKKGFDIGDYILERQKDGLPLESIAHRIAEEENADVDYFKVRFPNLASIVTSLVDKYTFK